MGYTEPSTTRLSQELNSHRKNALISREIDSTSAPASGERKSWSTA
jgi:hypothetical protein